MAVLSFTVDERAPYAGGRGFGEAGPYERLTGTLLHAVDPAHPRNRAVADLDLAPRADDGTVRFRNRVTLLRPVRAEGPGPLLVDVVNRGRPTMPSHLHLADVDPLAVLAEPPPGDGDLLARGWTVACVGWQHDLAVPGLLGLEAPPALEGGAPVAGNVTFRFQPAAPTRTVRLAAARHLPYPVDVGRAAGAELWEGDGPGARLVPRDEWDFAQECDGTTTPSAEHVHRPAGFRAGVHHHVVYPSVDAPVVGCGLLALRDASAFLRSGHADNPGPPARTSVGFGVSQSGRLLRQMLADGLVVAEDGSLAFDGLLVVIAGARGGDFNRRFATPGNLPVGDGGMTAPARYADLLAPLRAGGGRAPKVVAVNTASEYWRGDGALLHLDGAGADAEPDPDVRLVAVAGAQHSAGRVPQERESVTLGLRPRYGLGTIDHRPVTRAALAALQRWLDDGAPPPPDVHPRVGDGTAVPREAAAAAARAVGLAVCDPPAAGPVAPVSALDADGNERGGVRLPDVAVPLGVHAGWNLWPEEAGAGGAAVPLLGLTRWFDAGGIRRRYGDRDAYLALVDGEIERLVGEGWVLASDAGVLRAGAAARWDDATGEGDPGGGAGA